MPRRLPLPQPGQVWRPTRPGSRSAERRIVEGPTAGDVWFLADDDPRPSAVPPARWRAWVRREHAVVEEAT